MNDWLTTDCETAEMFLVMLSAIPKEGKPPTVASNLRPISVTSIWYKIVAKAFAERLSHSLVTLYSPNQHGFCPKRNVQTALANIMCTVEWARGRGDKVYMMQIDVDKAYDSVCRPAFSQVMQHMGIADCDLFKFIERGMRLG